MDTFKDFFLRKTDRPHIYSKMVAYNCGEEVLWGILTDIWLDGFSDWLRRRVAGSSASVYFSIIKTCLDRAKKVGYIFPSENYKEILRAKNNKVVKTFLTWKELRTMEKYRPKNSGEAFVLSRFLIGAYTGCRQSDFNLISEDNIVSGKLEYISLKTDTQACIPVKPLIRELIKVPHREMSLWAFNDILRNICKKCRIRSKVTVVKAGEHHTGEKWQFVSSHTARISFATNLYLLGADIFSISKLMGHSDISQTAKYIATQEVKLGHNALLYFK